MDEILNIILLCMMLLMAISCNGLKPNADIRGIAWDEKLIILEVTCSGSYW